MPSNKSKRVQAKAGLCEKTTKCDKKVEERKTSKRPKGANSNGGSKKKIKKEEKCSLLKEISSSESVFNFSSPKDFLKSLLGLECSLETFFTEYWEQKPLHIPVNKRIGDLDTTQNEKVENYVKQIFSPKILESIVETNDVEYTVDVNACKFVGGTRENYQGDGKVQIGDIKDIFGDQKMTVQFHQPQRFHDEIWKIQESMESYFGCLVGSNIYMTPDGTQGLAPHYDDVEVFILQLGGTKDWKLYSPVQELTRDCSPDLDEDVMDKLELLMEVTMKPGDLLYFPRGTVHQAKVKDGCGMSTHITISTFQNHCWGDYLVTTLPHLIDRCTDKHRGFRKGLPVNYQEKVASKEFASQFLKMLDQLKSAVSDVSMEFQRINVMTLDFYANRLPPLHASTDPVGKIPNLKSSVKFVHPGHVVISRGKGLDDGNISDEEEDELLDNDFNNNIIDEENEVFVYYSNNNKRKLHMQKNSNKPSGLRFDISCMEPLQKLKASGLEYVDVQNLNLPIHLGLDMLIGLWAEGLIECKPDTD